MSQIMALALLVMFLAVALVGIALLAVSGPETATAERDLGEAIEPETEPAEIRPA